MKTRRLASSRPGAASAEPAGARHRGRGRRGAKRDTAVRPFTRKKPVRAPFPAHLPRERVVIPGPTACPCCGGRLAKLGETITETLEVVPRQWKSLPRRKPG